MGQISNKMLTEVRTTLSRPIINIADIRKAKKNAQAKLKTVKSVENFLKEGHTHDEAIYGNTQHLASMLSEDLIMIDPLDHMYRFWVKMEDLHMPAFPPISPMTRTYFFYWTHFDASFGSDNETFGNCLLNLVGEYGINPDQKKALQNFCESRMGIYEVVDTPSVDRCAVRELVTNCHLDVQLRSGYNGKRGDIIFMRLLPSLSDGNMHYGVTTPYQLEGYSKSDWLNYFARQNIVPGIKDAEEKLYRLFKYGNGDNEYWSEFVCLAYLNYRSDAIFLCGLPDKKSTWRHHDSFNALANYNAAALKAISLGCLHGRK